MGVVEHTAEEHSHCITCVLIKCSNIHPTTGGCPIIFCQLYCGARFHGCKQDEHNLLCRNARTPCLNKSHGCPMEMPRYKLGSHLEKCPASVIYCTMQWNRWPVYSKERQSRIPTIHAESKQLDVALALRDQRMLNEAMKAPSSSRRVLRNNHIQRFPSFSLWPGSEATMDTDDDESTGAVSDEESRLPCGVRSPPGLQSSVCKELFQATRRTTESLSAALKLATEDGLKTQGSNEVQDSLENDGALSPQVQVQPNTLLQNEAPGVSMDNTIYWDEYGVLLSREQAKALRKSKPNGAESVQNSTMCMDFATNESVQIAIAPTPRMRHRVVINIQPIQSDLDDGVEAALIKPESGAIPKLIQQPVITHKQILSLDMTLESIPHYQAKPKCMYTFLCAKKFRRDEYADHFKNIHVDIHAGLNGWLEQRCPLAQYGCSYSLPRLHPGKRGSKITYNETVESFGVKPISADDQTNHTPDAQHTAMDIDGTCSDSGASTCVSPQMKSLPFPPSTESDHDASISTTSPSEQESMSFIDLPYEIVTLILSYLDGFSLSNLALTNRAFRQICCTLLEEKGIVVQEWERQKVEEKVHWALTVKRWFFSTGFSPITKWGFEDNGHMSNHLKTCSYFKRHKETRPHCLHSINYSNYHTTNFWNTLHKMYPTTDIALLQKGEIINNPQAMEESSPEEKKD